MKANAKNLIERQLELENQLDILEQRIKGLEKRLPTLTLKYGGTVRKYIDEKVEKEVDEKYHANLIALITFINSIVKVSKND